MAIQRTIAVPCPASTGALGSFLLRTQSMKLRMWLGAAWPKLPGFLTSTLGFISMLLDCGNSE
jgi:hypothetical protein